LPNGHCQVQVSVDRCYLRIVAQGETIPSTVGVSASTAPCIGRIGGGVRTIIERTTAYCGFTGGHVVEGLMPDVPMSQIFAGVLPFWFAMMVCIAILISFPEIALVIPNAMIR
jgi:TRAP-type mannitol/chloroaromatic compound transport system permease large subunit